MDHQDGVLTVTAQHTTRTNAGEYAFTATDADTDLICAESIMKLLLKKQRRRKKFETG